MDLPIVVESDEIVVAGFVDQIRLEVDAGPKGQRGSIIFSGVGDPPTVPPSSDPLFNNVDVFQSNDYYIKLSSTGYSWLYKYEDLPGGATWTPLVKMNPPLYVKRHTVAFTSGTGTTLSIPLVNILGTTTTTLTEDKFIINGTVHYTSDDTNVYALSVRSTVVNGSNLDIKFNVRQLTAAAVSAPTANLVINVTIGVGA